MSCDNHYAYLYILDQIVIRSTSRYPETVFRPHRTTDENGKYILVGFFRCCNREILLATDIVCGAHHRHILIISDLRHRAS